jgi:hypothetical protein
MASAAKLVEIKPTIEPELREFLDSVLVPMLVRDAISDLAKENLLAFAPGAVAHSPATALCSAEEMA